MIRQFLYQILVVYVRSLSMKLPFYCLFIPLVPAKEVIFDDFLEETYLSGGNKTEPCHLFLFATS